MKYFDKTERVLKFRLADNRSYINNQDEAQATGKHFNSPGHSLADLSMTVLEKVNKSDEKYFIRKFHAFYRGMNRQP